MRFTSEAAASAVLERSQREIGTAVDVTGEGGAILALPRESILEGRSRLDERQRYELERLLERVEERAMDVRLSPEAASRYDEEARALRARLRADCMLVADPDRAA